MCTALKLEQEHLRVIYDPLGQVVALKLEKSTSTPARSRIALGENLARNSEARSFASAWRASSVMLSSASN